MAAKKGPSGFAGGPLQENGRLSLFGHALVELIQRQGSRHTHCQADYVGHRRAHRPGGPYGIAPKVTDHLAKQVKELLAVGHEVGVVVGGGNIFRGMAGAAGGMERAQADYMGMLATVMNALALQDAFEHNDVPCRVMSAIQMNEICEPYIRRRAINHLSKGNVVIFAAGSGNPYFTTDTAAALRACEIGAEILIKATKVDGIYDKDPVKCADAVRFDKITYHEVLVRGLQVMDSTATALCQDNRMPLLVLNIDGEDTVKRALSGEPVGTLVYQED